MTMSEETFTVTGRHALCAMVVSLVALLAYAAPIGVVLHQAALLAGPGDRIAVVFPPRTSTHAALEAIGGAGAVMAGKSRVPGHFAAEVIDADAVERLARQGLVLRVPQEPTLASCFDMLTDRR
jgi:hypothetical protein